MDNLNRYKSTAELKALAKERMFGNYGVAVGALMLVSMITMFISFFTLLFTDTRTFPGLMLDFIISYAVSVFTVLFTSGTKYFYLKISCGRPVTINDAFYGFKLYPGKALRIQLYLSGIMYLSMLPKTILSYIIGSYPSPNPSSYSSSYSWIMLLYSLSVILWGVVTVIVSLVYGQALFLLHDFPNYSAAELLTMSRQLMKGNKGRLFYMLVSFLPLLLLGLLSCGIAYLWLTPYMNAANAEFFMDLMQNSRLTSNA